MRPWRPLQERTYRAGPWAGMRFSTPQAADSPQYAELLLNMYIRDADTSPVAVGRPGFLLAGAGGGVGTQLGGAGARTHQLIYQLTLQDGTEVSLLIVGGKLYTYNHSTDVFTESVTAANFVTAFGGAVTDHLSATARCYAVTFANKVVISDGVHAPFTWNGTAGAGGLTKLSACPVLYGQPWVRSGRLCGIVGTNTASRISFCWSEVGDPTVGYGTAPYSANIWDVVQTGSAIFYAGAATNDSMILARANSVTRILGDIDVDWISSNTREAVHEFVGTLSPGGMLVHQDTVYFFANDGRIMRVRAGGVAEEIATGVREYIAQYAPAKFAIVEALVWDAGSTGEFLLWGIAGPTPSYADTFLVVDTKTGELVGLWSGWQQSRWGVWKNTAGVPVLVHGGGSTNDAATDGYTYLHGATTGSTWTDEFNTADVAIGHTVSCHALGWNESRDKYWDLVNATVTVPSTLSNVGIQAKTPYGVSNVALTATITGGGSLWDTVTWDNLVWGGDSSERQMSVGVGTAGRWCQISMNHATAGEQFQVQSIAVRATDDTDSPLIA